MKPSRIVKAASLAAMTAVGLIVLSASTASGARPIRPGPWDCICPHVYAPVLCPDGNVYSNSCVASCHHQTNCVPTGPGPVEI